jgi:hypothetical protein
MRYTALTALTISTTLFSSANYIPKTDTFDKKKVMVEGIPRVYTTPEG